MIYTRKKRTSPRLLPGVGRWIGWGIICFTWLYFTFRIGQFLFR